MSDPNLTEARKRITRITRITDNRTAGPNHAVLTIEGGKGDLYRRGPCPTCPWRVDAVGEFPAEAFKHSAPVAYDMATHVFACHQSGSSKPAICAGFLLRNSVNNLGVRLKLCRGLIDLNQVTDGGHELHASYRDMAVANGVNLHDPVLASCRADND